ncbi:MAG: helix-turn-helix domain-containing protein [Verrucomicrobiota bacterium]
MSVKFRSKCALASSLDIFGDKWTLLVIRDMFRGCTHFKDFEASPERIATNILSNRLMRLVEHGLVEKYPSKRILGRDAYRLTKQGRSLEPVLRGMLDWGKANIPGTGAVLTDF